MSSVPTDYNSQEVRFMRVGLGLARRGLGSVWPNPAVGCVIVSTKAKVPVIVGRGWTQPGGRPHAETEALRRAGSAAKGATAYVTLEPCCHEGKTPPCSSALIAAGVSRVVAAMEDPDPRVAGKGIAHLRDAGIEVDVGVCGDEATLVNAGFVSRITQSRPMVTLKIATTLDGGIATAKGESRWITGGVARRRVHLLRARHDAVLVGIGTALVDNPQLTCRLPGLEARSPIRIVVDTRLQLPLTSELVATAVAHPTWLLTIKGGDELRLKAYRECGVEVLEVEPDPDGYPNTLRSLEMLAEKGITRLLVEGGAGIAAAFLRAGVIDRIAWFRASTIMGGDGVPAVASYGLEHLKYIWRFETSSITRVGDDWLETYRRQG
jgi:diaminohydroxyphosphoribosylaminopyrimidine deaminase / 5-amino-6-(5-phosphoribosylamino)uracil reductase